MTTTTSPIGPAERLEKELSDRRDYADNTAYRLDRRMSLCWWGALVCAGIAAALGFIADIPEVKSRFNIEPWMISVFALIAGAFNITQAKTSWRAKSNMFYRHRDDIDNLLSRLRYEMPKAISDDNIALIAKTYREKKLEWGEKMRKLNSLNDEHSSGEHNTL